MAGNPTYGTDGLLATTIANYIPTLEDNVFGSKPLLWILKTAGRIKNMTGEKIVQPLIYAGASNVGSYEGTDVFATAANDGISAASFDWAQFYGLVHFSGIELAKNSGKQAILSLTEARMQQVELTMADALNTMLWGDGSGNSNKDLNGIAAGVSATDPSWGDYGGLDRTLNTWWVPESKTATTPNTLALADMANVYNGASEGNDHPDYAVTTQAGFEAYEALLTSSIRYEDPALGDAGFQNLAYKGVPITFDDDCDVAATTEATAPLWFLNTKYITLATLDGVWFNPSDMLQPTNQDAFYKHIKCYGNLVMSNVSRQGVLYDIHV